MRVKKANKAAKKPKNLKEIIAIAKEKADPIIQERMDKAHERAYPSEGPLTEADFLTAEEALAAEEQLLGKRGVPDDTSPLLCPLDDPLPNFLQIAAKAGPPSASSNPKFPVSVDGPMCPKPEGHEWDSEKKQWVKAKPVIYLPNPDNDKELIMKKPVRTVTLHKDHDLEYPDLYLAIHILPDPSDSKELSNFIKMFSRTGCYKADCIQDADLVVFGGGSDVDPRMYSETKHPMTLFSDDRDNQDMDAYLYCVEQGIPMFGVCRGAQFLHVCNGGKLYQDIDNHYGEHKMWCLKDKLLIERVSSSHHQSCRTNIANGMEILAVASMSDTRWLNADEKEEGKKPDIEAYFYRDTGCFGVQGHPEYAGYHKFQIWCLEKINELFMTNPDFSWQGSHYRMDPNLIGMRRMDETAKKMEEIELAYSQQKEA